MSQAEKQDIRLVADPTVITREDAGCAYDQCRDEFRDYVEALPFTSLREETNRLTFSWWDVDSEDENETGERYADDLIAYLKRSPDDHETHCQLFRVIKGMNLPSGNNRHTHIGFFARIAQVLAKTPSVVPTSQAPSATDIEYSLGRVRKALGVALLLSERVGDNDPHDAAAAGAIVDQLQEAERLLSGEEARHD
jgi:hypothetical protein